MSELLVSYEHGTARFEEVLEELGERGVTALESLEPAARQIVSDVRQGGDAQVRRYAERMDGRAPAVLLERQFDGEGAVGRLPREVAQGLRAAVGRLQRFFQRQKEASFRYEEGGVTLGQRVRAVRRAAVLVPLARPRAALGLIQGATAARVAGVSDVLAVTAEADDLVLAAAHLSGVTALVRVGGAQAVAALAFGTESLPVVDVIAGDGGLHAACAKRLVFGRVQVDGLGGPPEVVVLADGSARASLVAADLLVTAELEEGARAMLVATEERVVAAVRHELSRQLVGLPRRAVAVTSLEQGGVAFVVRQREQMMAVVEALAPAQVAVHLERAEDALERLQSVGGVSWGGLTPADAAWLAGVLPSGGSARFSGAAGVGSFLARVSFARVGAGAIRAQADGLVVLARASGQEALARAVVGRLGVPEAQERGGDEGDGRKRGRELGG